MSVSCAPRAFLRVKFFDSKIMKRINLTTCNSADRIAYGDMRLCVRSGALEAQAHFTIDPT